MSDSHPDTPPPSDSPVPPRRRIDPDNIFRPGVVTARYAHPSRYPLFARAALAETARQELATTLLALDPEMRHDLDHSFQDAVRTAAQQLLAEAPFAADVGRLPFRAGDRIVALGDSITDDACSWAEMLHSVLSLTRMDGEVINAGIAGNITAEAIARIDLIAENQPTWVIQLLGTNDVRRHGRAEVRLVSQHETLRNLEGLGRLIEEDMSARLVRMILPPVRAQLAAEWPDFRKQSLTWREDDVAELARATRALDPTAVDLHTALHMKLDRWLLPDGVHPTVAGQQQILRTLVHDLGQTGSMTPVTRHR